MLRNPVHRTYSAFVHYLRAGRLNLDADLMETIRSVPPGQDPLGLVAGSWYAASLEPYFERFGDRLLVFLNDDVAGEPDKVYARALAHLGATPGLHDPDLVECRFAGGTPASSAYAEEGGGRRELTLEERSELFEYFREDVARLEELLGRDLSTWHPR